MTEQDRPEFAALILQMAEISANKSGENVSDAFISFYFEILKDMELPEIRSNAAIYFRNAKPAFFPSPADLRNEGDPEQIAVQAFARIEDYLNKYYAPEIGACMMKVIEEKMQKAGEKHLIGYLYKWGPEIVNGGNPTATRAQFIKSFRADVKTGRFQELPETGGPKQIGDILNHPAGLLKENG